MRPPLAASRAYTEAVRPTEIIAAHTNTDFDAFAAMIAAGKLYPNAHIYLSGALNKNVKEFCSVYGERLNLDDASRIDLSAVRRLIAIETLDANRLGELGKLLSREEVEVISFDHHADVEPPVRPGVQRITSTDGALTTLMLRILSERDLPVSPLEATAYALGIHEDTGSLTFSTTTERDAEALAFCMRLGASPVLIERFLHSPLVAVQRKLLAQALEEAQEVVAGHTTAMIAALRSDEYVEEVAVVAHRYLDVTGVAVFVLLVEMQERVFVIARTRGEALDVGAALEAVGGGGHAAAASAVVRDLDLHAARAAVVEGLQAAAARRRRARDLMRGDLGWVDQEKNVDEALLLCRRRALAGLAVAANGALVGTVSEADLRRALGHELGHAPVKAVMTSGVPTVDEDAGESAVAEALAASPIGAVIVLRGGEERHPTLEKVAGVVRRTDLVHLWGGLPADEPLEQAGLNLASRLGELGLDDLLAHVQAVATGYAGVYLVGGAVRDLLLEERIFDLDVAVEGDGIAFAGELARRVGGHVRPHPKFRTAVMVAAQGDGGEGLRVDVASTRSEFYEAPAALPTVERATLRADLARRDFTMNAMAVSLKADDLGRLHDYFGGLEDLAAGRIVVLHNLSFIEDPTRIFRALRYETRYGLRMDSHTFNLARACCQMDLVGDLTSARLRDELVLLLRESPIDPALRRMQQLGLSRSVHPRFSTGSATRSLLREAEARWRRYGLAAEVPLWRLRLVWLLRNLGPEEVAAWAERMRFRKADGVVLQRAMVVGRRLAERLQGGMGEADLYEAAAGEPLEALVVAMVLGQGVAERRLAAYLTQTRQVRLDIDGDDLIALGFARSPELGSVLRTLLRMRINGLIGGREEQLEAARRLRVADAGRQR